ncbi:MAG: SRPBCC domain-containing protein [Burkholderiaceae bacterium]|nr:SRPBCC domain-containing protein [Burkholderiaceae bacterium]
MPTRETKFTVNAPPMEVWGFVRDVHALCSCIPGVEQVRVVDDRTAQLTVKEKVGVVPLIVDLTAHIDSEEPPNRLHAIATAEHLSMEIDVALEARGMGTEMRGLISAKGEGPLKPVVDRLFERRADERTAQFAEHLEQRFGAVAPAAAAPEGVAPGAVAPVVGRDWLARLGAWLGGVWRRLFSRVGPGSH